MMDCILRRLSNPTATLSGVDQNGASHDVLLTLSAPTTEPADKVCTALSAAMAPQPSVYQLLSCTLTPSGLK